MASLAFFAAGGWIAGLFMLVGAAFVVPADDAFTHLRVGSLRWALVGLAVAAVGIHYLTAKNWGAGIVFVLLALLPLGFAADLHEITRRVARRRNDS